MSVDLARMTAYIGLQISNQLEDGQINLLINLTHMEEVEARPWARLQTDFAFNSFGLYTTGTVSFTQGSPIITGAGTAWTTSMIGMVMRIGTISGTASTQLVPIPINSVDATNQIITLQDPYPLAGASGMGYQIFPLFYSIRGIQRVIGVRQQVQLGRRNHGFINQRDPYRYNQSSPARFWAPFGQNHDGSAKIELWPIETISNPYSVYGLKGHLDLMNPTDLPLIPSGLIVNKTIGKCCETVYSLTGDTRWVTQRDFYYKRYGDELDRAIESDREEFGVIQQIKDSIGDPDSDSYRPGLDSFYNRDVEST
jgi:hypothetical protein